MANEYLVELDKDLEELIPSFVENRKKEVLELVEFCRNNNIDELKRIGHRLAGTAGSYGFDTIGKFGVELEAAAKANKIDIATEIVEKYKVFLAKMILVYK